LIGPWLAQSLGEFKEDTPDSEWKEIFDSLKKTGITCHFGEWLTEGMPKVILVDFSKLWPQINDFKWQLWDAFGVDSLNSGFEFDEPVVFGYAVAKLLENVDQRFNGKKMLPISTNGCRARDFYLPKSLALKFQQFLPLMPRLWAGLLLIIMLIFIHHWKN